MSPGPDQSRVAGRDPPPAPAQTRRLLAGRVGPAARPLWAPPPRPRRAEPGAERGSSVAERASTHDPPRLTLVRRRDYPRPSFAPAKHATRARERSCRTRNPRRKPTDRRIAIPEGERQYHIGLGPGELAEYILLPGDPDRTTRIATRFDSIELEHRHREFASATGIVSRPAGLGGLDRHRHGQRRDRRRRDPGDHGTAHLHPGRVVRGAPAGDGAGGPGHLDRRGPARDRPRASSSTMGTRRSPIYEAVAGAHRGRGAARPPVPRRGDGDGAGVLRRAGAPIPQLPIRYPDLAEDMARQRVMNFEMEASALLVLASLARCRAGVVCAVYANRTTGDVRRRRPKDAAEAACVDTGLESLLVLAEMDRQKREAHRRTAGARRCGPRHRAIRP